MLLFGCTAQQPEAPAAPVPEQEPVKETQVEPPAPEPIAPEPIAPEPIVPKPAEPEPEICDTSLEAHQVEMIKLDLNDNPKKMVTRTDEDIRFRFYPLDITGKEIIPAEGNLAVQLFSTIIGPNGEIEEDEIVYSKSFYIKDSDVLSDCGPQEIVISFEDILANPTYQKYAIRDNDPGVLYVSFKRSGSQAKFETKFEAFKHDTSVLP